jgi:anti-sigma B factor antagonist
MANSERSNLRIEQTAEGVVVHLVGCGSLNEQTTPPVEVQLLALAAEQGGAHLLVDLSNVHYMSSIGLGMLIGLRHKMRAAGGRLTLRGVSDEIYDMFDATKLTRLLDVQRDNPPSP